MTEVTAVVPEHWGLVQSLLMLLMHMQSHSSKKSSDAGRSGSRKLSLLCVTYTRGEEKACGRLNFFAVSSRFFLIAQILVLSGFFLNLWAGGRLQLYGVLLHGLMM